MAKNNRLIYNYLDTTTTVMTGFTAGTVTPGNTLLMNRPVKDSLSALVTVEAETDGITLGAFWQVSNDATTWVKVVPYNNAAFVVWATGTAGADTPVTAMLPAPKAVYGWRYARVAIENLAQDGLIADTYRIGYCYEDDNVV